jgi:hypothetical protein
MNGLTVLQLSATEQRSALRQSTSFGLCTLYAQCTAKCLLLVLL